MEKEACVNSYRGIIGLCYLPLYCARSEQKTLYYIDVNGTDNLNKRHQHTQILQNLIKSLSLKDSDVYISETQLLAI